VMFEGRDVWDISTEREMLLCMKRICGCSGGLFFDSCGMSPFIKWFLVELVLVWVRYVLHVRLQFMI